MNLKCWGLLNKDQNDNKLHHHKWVPGKSFYFLQDLFIFCLVVKIVGACNSKHVLLFLQSIDHKLTFLQKWRTNARWNDSTYSWTVIELWLLRLIMKNLLFGSFLNLPWSLVMRNIRLHIHLCVGVCVCLVWISSKTISCGIAVFWKYICILLRINPGATLCPAVTVSSIKRDYSQKSKTCMFSSVHCKSLSGFLCLALQLL